MALWKAAQAKIREECGLDKDLFTACELIALRTIAAQLAEAGAEPKPARKTKPIVRR